MTELVAVADLNYTQAKNIALGISKKDDTYELHTTTTDPNFITQVLNYAQALEVDATVNAVSKIVLPDFPGITIYLVGLGDNPELDTLRQTAGSVTRAARGNANLTISIAHRSNCELEAICEGALLGAYQYTTFLSSAKEPLTQVQVVTDLQDSAEIIARTTIVTQAVNTIRELTNTPGNHLNPEILAEKAVTEAAAAGCQTKVYEGQDLITENLAGLRAVGAGSATAPRLVKLTWEPESFSKHIALVGKGITFDTGGYSLKPSNGITDMKTDMCGAATVFQTLLTAAKLHLPIKVTAWLCLAENMVSGTASRPDDVIVYRNGKSVEINNTDAEGRLVMADGLIMASEEKPDAIIDVATLTGAQIIALGDRTTGVMGTPAVREDIVAAASSVSEDVWPMPLPEYLKETMKSDIADTLNTGSRSGGMLTAGLFLQEFVGDTPWAHLDIAGPSFNKAGAYGHTPKGATGVMLRTLLQYLEDMA